MAKKKRKPRTPPPPRRPESRGDATRQVQAPQVRKRTRDTSERDRRARLLLYSFGASGVVGLIVVLLVLLAFTGKGKPNLNVNFAELPGISHGKAPWPAQINDLALRLKPIGLHALPAEALKEHIHQHLDIYVNGKHERVPQSVGIAVNQFITELHTHDTSGIVHVESGTVRPYSLGEFFAVWGVFLSKRCIGGYCGKKPLRVLVNGHLYKGDPVTLELASHQEIAIVFGKPPKNIPDKYDFPPGY